MRSSAREACCRRGARLPLHPQSGFWKETIETLALVVGCHDARARAWRATRHCLRKAATALRRHAPVLDLMQTLPTFCYLIPALVLFGLGIAPA